ncbi:hypothetical protein CGGC5_v014825 [Colletotrichum fructicola Nara gc5]|uniref:Uncharacterized protein n=1 Tax=Colletotrichum fructicola (strain Nara gc5) TaxID=1213859 RepID=A0A7J6IJZ5_COLFN|nr:hypothetical protein CGGC5_v014825 [Colletotrichum fructicola Nara gc5]
MSIHCLFQRIFVAQVQKWARTWLLLTIAHVVYHDNRLELVQGPGSLCQLPTCLRTAGKVLHILLFSLFCNPGSVLIALEALSGKGASPCLSSSISPTLQLSSHTTALGIRHNSQPSYISTSFPTIRVP